MRIFRQIFFVLLMIIGAQQAATAASDQCKDALIYKPMNKEQYKSDTLLYLHETEKIRSGESKSSDRSLGGSIQGTPFSAKDKQNASSYFENDRTFLEYYEKKEDFVRYWGSENVLSEWRKCMTARGDVDIFFQPEGDPHGNDVTLIVLYSKAGGENPPQQYPLTLIDNVDLGDQVLRSSGNLNCIQKGAVLQPGSTCRIALTFKSPWSKANFIASFERPDGVKVGRSAYLPPRAKWKLQVIPWPSTGPAWTEAGTNGMPYTEIKQIPANNGYKINETLNTRMLDCRGGSRCATTARLNPLGESVTLEVTLGSRSVLGYIYTKGQVSGTQFRLAWDPPPPE